MLTVSPFSNDESTQRLHVPVRLLSVSAVISNVDMNRKSVNDFHVRSWGCGRLNRKFKPPKNTDRKQWDKVRFSFRAVFGFSQSITQDRTIAPLSQDNRGSEGVEC